MGALEVRLGRSETLAEAHEDGAFAGSGMTPVGRGLEAPGGDAGMADNPRPVPGVQHRGYATPLPQMPSDLDPARREGLGRAQQHAVTLGVSHEEYVDEPYLDGQHNVIVGRPILALQDQMLPWEASPDVLFRTVPPRDADNPPPGGCE